MLEKDVKAILVPAQANGSDTQSWRNCGDGGLDLHGGEFGEYVNCTSNTE